MPEPLTLSAKIRPFGCSLLEDGTGAEPSACRGQDRGPGNLRLRGILRRQGTDERQIDVHRDCGGDLSQPQLHSIPDCLCNCCACIVRMGTAEKLEREIAEMAARMDVAIHRSLTCIRQLDEQRPRFRGSADACGTSRRMSRRAPPTLRTARKGPRSPRARENRRMQAPEAVGATLPNHFTKLSG